MKNWMLIVMVVGFVFCSVAGADTFTEDSNGAVLQEPPGGVNSEAVFTDPEPLTPQIDQNQPEHTAERMADFSQGGLAQSFQQTNTNICGAGILLGYLGTSDNVTIQLWDDLPDTGTMLAEASATGTALEWVDVYWEPVDVVPGTTYYLVFTGNTTLCIDGAGDVYPYGMVHANDYDPFPEYDYTFRTYWEDNVSLERYTWGTLKTLY